MDEKYQALLELQTLDQEIERAERKLADFQPALEEIDAPVHEQEQQVAAVRSRLDEMKQEARRLERGAEDKRDRLKQYEERMDRVRNAREAAAVRTEIELVRGAAEADEDEAVELMEQITRLELKLDEMESKLEALRDEVEPERHKLLEERAEAEASIGVLRDRRENQAVRIDPDLHGLYERVRTGRTKVVIAALTADGACGHCFSMIPIQQQNEIRQASEFHRCEACGVVLYAEA